MTEVYLKEINSYTENALKDFVCTFFSTCGNFLRNKKKILLKPNLLQARKPEKGVTTHPEFVRQIIRALKEFGEFDILLGDSPGANFISYDKVLEKTGISKICAEENVKIIKIENFKPITVDGILISSIVNEVDLIVNIPKLKTHSLTGLTLAVKNLFGLVPGTNKVSYHRNNPKNTDLAEAIFKIYDIVKDKTVHIIDGILAHEENGPSNGKGVYLNIVGASMCGISLDMAICDLLNLDRTFCLTNLAAIKNGFAKDFVVKGDISKRSIKLPFTKRNFNPPAFLKRFFADKIYIKPEINKKCIKCLLCLKSCPVCAIKKTADGDVVIDKSLCIECFCCHEVCEVGAIDLKRSLLHRITAR